MTPAQTKPGVKPAQTKPGMKPVQSTLGMPNQARSGASPSQTRHEASPDQARSGASPNQVRHEASPSQARHEASSNQARCEASLNQASPHQASPHQARHKASPKQARHEANLSHTANGFTEGCSFTRVVLFQQSSFSSSPCYNNHGWLDIKNQLPIFFHLVVATIMWKAITMLLLSNSCILTSFHTTSHYAFCYWDMDVGFSTSGLKILVCVVCMMAKKT